MTNFFLEATLIAAFGTIMSYKIRKMYTDKGEAYYNTHITDKTYTYEAWIKEWDKAFATTGFVTVAASIIAAVLMIMH